MSAKDTQPDFIHQTIIRADAATLWNALVDGRITRQYYFDTTVEGDAAPGGTLVYRNDAGEPILTAEVIAAEPHKRLEMTFEPHFIPGAPASRHVFLIDAMPGACRLTVEHYNLPEVMKGIRDGWVLVFSRLKTLLETGEPLPVTMAMMAG